MRESVDYTTTLESERRPLVVSTSISVQSAHTSATVIHGTSDRKITREDLHAIAGKWQLVRGHDFTQHIEGRIAAAVINRHVQTPPTLNV